jgi:hypothetical protein
MALPEDTLPYLLNWMERIGASDEMRQLYQDYWLKNQNVGSLQATPIPCPNCYINLKSIIIGLKQTSNIKDTGIERLRCIKCKNIYNLCGEIEENEFVDICKTGSINQLIETSKKYCLYLHSEDNTYIKLTEKIIKEKYKELNEHYK